MSLGKIPHKWFYSRFKLWRYITYWGDIFTGYLHECPSYEDGFFIIPSYHHNELQNLADDERTPEQYRKLGWEINDHRVIIESYRIDTIPKQEFNTNHRSHLSKSGQEFKEMFVFGAGASANCCFKDHKVKYEQDQWRAPLGFEIFNERYEEICSQFEGVKLAIPEFELKNNTIEECLEADWSRYSKTFFPELTYRHINIQFYLQQLFQKITKHTMGNFYRMNLYQLFAKQLQDKTAKQSSYRPVVINFNYDTILDQFLDKTFRYVTNHIDDYIDWESRSVVHFKPHGSCNWGWKFPKEQITKLGNDIPAKLYEQKVTPAALYYQILGEYRSMVNDYSYTYEKGHNPVGKHSLDKLQIQVVNDEPAYPALLLPFKEKDEFVMPYHHKSALKFVLSDIERLFVIGWKGSEQLFLDELEKAYRLKDVIIVNPDFETVKSNLESHIKTNCTWTHIIDFEDFIKKEMIS
jgi:hypothetical protein